MTGALQRRIAWTAVAGLFFAQLHLLFSKAYDPDEFEHLHVGLCISRGLVPYRDFFEHHGPVAYISAAPLAVLLGATPHLLTVNRLLSFVCVLLTAAAVARITGRLYGSRWRAVSLLWLLTLPWFVAKSVEWRPDGPAAALLAWGAAALIDRRFFFAGVLLGAATLTTQKTLFLVAGLAAAAIQREGRVAAARTSFVLLFGAAVPWGVATAAFRRLAGAEAFFRCILFYPAVWPMRVDLGAVLFQSLLDAAPASLTLGAAAWIWGGRFHRSLAARRRGEALLAWPCLLHWLGWPFVSAAYLQYHFLGLPLLAPLVAGLLRTLSPRSPLPRRKWTLAVSAGGASMMFCAALLSRARFRPQWAPDETIVWCGAALAAFSALACSLKVPGARGLLLLGLFSPTCGWFWMQHYYLPNFGAQTRSKQLESLAQINRLIPATATVQDGFTGMGCLRPHADYWWWINEHSLALMHRVGALPALRSHLSEGRADFLIADFDLWRAVEPVGGEVARRYELILTNENRRFRLFRRRAAAAAPSAAVEKPIDRVKGGSIRLP